MHVVKLDKLQLFFFFVVELKLSENTILHQILFTQEQNDFAEVTHFEVDDLRVGVFVPNFSKFDKFITDWQAVVFWLIDCLFELRNFDFERIEGCRFLLKVLFDDDPKFEEVWRMIAFICLSFLILHLLDDDGKRSEVTLRWSSSKTILNFRSRYLFDVFNWSSAFTSFHGGLSILLYWKECSN